MKFINIGSNGKDKDVDALINIDLPSVVNAIKTLPKWMKYILVIIICSTIGYFISFKSGIYITNTDRMEELTESSIKVNQKIADVQNILYNYNVILRYYNTSLKLLSINQALNIERQKMIVEYLGEKQNATNYRNLIKRLEDNTANCAKIEELYNNLMKANEEDISKIIDNINNTLTKIIDEPKLLNN